MGTKKTVKAKAKAKASVRVNVNVNSKNRKVVRGRFPVPYPTALPPVRVEVQSSAPQQPIIIHQPSMMRDTTHPVGINITTHNGGGHTGGTPEITTTQVEPPNTLQQTGRLLRSGTQGLSTALQGAGAVASAVGAPLTGGLLAGAGALAQRAGTAGRVAEQAGNAQQAGSQLVNAGRNLVQGARNLVSGETARQAVENVQNSFDAMTNSQLQEHLRGRGVHFTTRTRRAELLRLAHT